MNGHDELLSAYHDGELSDAERRRVEERLREQPELGEVLDEYRHVSDALKSLPRPQAPSDLRPAVMQRIDPSTTVRPASDIARPTRRPRWMWTAGTTASLLIAVALVLLLRDRVGVPPQEDLARGLPAPAAAPDAATMSRESTPADVEAADAAPMPADAARTFAGAGPSSAASELFDQDLAFLDFAAVWQEAPTPGEQLELLRQVDDQLVLIEFRVVDVIEAFGQVQVLLAEHGITPLSADESPADAPAVEGDRLHAIMLEASNEKLLAALDDIDMLESVVLVDTNGADMAQELGVDPAAVPPRMQQERAPADAASAPVADAVENGPSASAAERPGEPSAEAELADDAQRRFAQGPPDYQMAVPLFDGVLREMEDRQQQRSREQSIAQAAGEQRESDSAADDDQSEPPAEEVDRPARSRMLIVFVPDR